MNIKQFIMKNNITEYDKIKVTSNGAFYMSSEDIFDDSDKALKFLKRMKDALNKRISGIKKETIKTSLSAKN